MAWKKAGDSLCRIEETDDIENSSAEYLISWIPIELFKKLNNLSSFNYYQGSNR